MASTSAVFMAMPITYASNKRVVLTSDLFKPLPMRSSSSKRITSSRANGSVQVRASLKEKAVAGLTAATLTASMVIPEVAQAAGNDFSPSLKNFLLSIVAGGVVLTGILGAIIGVSNFDPVKRA